MQILRFALLGVLALAALVLVACGSDGATAPIPTGTAAGSATPNPTAAPTLTATPEATPLPTGTASLPEALLQLLREDLAQSFIVNPIDTPDSIEVVGVEEVLSPDECLPGLPPPADCPPANLTPGYRVTLRRLDFGVEYIYYTDGEQRFAGPWGLPLPSPVPVSPDALPPGLLELLREDLGRRLSVTQESIGLTLVEEAVWGACLGLPAPEQCLPGLTLGYRVTLSIAGQEHRYHTDREERFRYAGPVDGP